MEENFKEEWSLLLIYDANWHLHFFDEDRLKRVREREERYFRRYGHKEIVAVENMEFFGSSPFDKYAASKMGQRDS